MTQSTASARYYYIYRSIGEALFRKIPVHSSEQPFYLSFPSYNQVNTTSSGSTWAPPSRCSNALEAHSLRTQTHWEQAATHTHTGWDHVAGCPLSVIGNNCLCPSHWLDKVWGLQQPMLFLWASIWYLLVPQQIKRSLGWSSDNIQSQ